MIKKSRPFRMGQNDPTRKLRRQNRFKIRCEAIVEVDVAAPNIMKAMKRVKDVPMEEMRLIELTPYNRTWTKYVHTWWETAMSRMFNKLFRDALYEMVMAKSPVEQHLDMLAKEKEKRSGKRK